MQNSQQGSTVWLRLATQAELQLSSKLPRSPEKQDVYASLGGGAGEHPRLVFRCGCLSDRVTMMRLSHLVSLWDAQGESFNSMVAIVILLNAIEIGFETEWGDDYLIFQMFENVFTLFFLTEMLLKICQLGCCGYVCCYRNLFDAFLVIVAVGDLYIMPLVLDEAQDPQLQLIKVLRLFRVLRLLRIFTVFRELHLILDAFFKACTPVFWVSVLVLIFDYICAIFLTQIVGHHAYWWGDKEDQVYGWFGTVGNSVRTLFIIMTLEEWDGIVLVLSEQLNACVVFLLAMAYIFITAYTMLSIITGSISEALITAQQQDELHRIEEAEKTRTSLAEGVRNLLKKVDVDGSGYISSMELSIAHSKAGNRIDHMLAMLDINMNFNDLFELIERLESSDDGRTEEVSIDDVADALNLMSGNAKSHTVMAVKHLFLKKELEAKQRFEEIEAQISKTKAYVERVNQKLNNLLSWYDLVVPDAPTLADSGIFLQPRATGLRRRQMFNVQSLEKGFEASGKQNELRESDVTYGRSVTGSTSSLSLHKYLPAVPQIPSFFRSRGE